MSSGLINHGRLANAMSRLCVRVEVHSHLVGVSQVVGISMMVGIRIFSIVEDLGRQFGHFHVCGLWLLIVPGLHLLRKLKMLVKAGGWLKS